MKNLIDYYGVLELSYYATTEEIKEAYREKVKETNSDKTGGDFESFQLIKEAYDVLSIEEKRGRYDDILFRATNFNVLAAIPKKGKDDSLQKEKKIDRKEKRTWRYLFCLSLTVNLISIGFMIYLYYQSQLANKDNNLLNNQIMSMIKENEELKETVVSQQNINQELQGQVTTLQEENSKTEVVSSEQTEPQIENNTGYVTLGMTEDQVNEIMGTPDKIQFSNWYYGSDWISFGIHDKKVRGWNNESGTLRVK